MSSLQIGLINILLVQVKRIIQERPKAFNLLSERQKNEKTMLMLGFTPQNVKEEILSLTHKDYLWGPEDNLSEQGPKKGHVWKFGKTIDGIEIYIKLHMVPTKYEDVCVCISFHEADYPLNYPFK